MLSLGFLLPTLAFAAKQPNQSRTYTPVEYRNRKYNFCLSLPEGWSGYKVIIGKYEGDSTESFEVGKRRVTLMPFITIRHPQWTPQEPRQDIPIMVLTHEQWRLWQDGKLILSATNGRPGELGHNSKYVFAVPPRYNADDLPGWREVDKVVAGHSFHAPCKR